MRRAEILLRCQEEEINFGGFTQTHESPNAFRIQIITM
ncbi:hypothetical protein EYF80_037629 [Liparis tanakae]|uniref:Uncharacterized protein n=1 Tax=Liparis tanakae TaxID=230148 RepID=A0A4Z2GFL8_9TELE|nr:hypothetical protein EYF80_037629 [Liparis tanakae]